MRCLAPTEEEFVTAHRVQRSAVTQPAPRPKLRLKNKVNPAHTTTMNLGIVAMCGAGIVGIICAHAYSMMFLFIGAAAFIAAVSLIGRALTGPPKREYTPVATPRAPSSKVRMSMEYEHS